MSDQSDKSSCDEPRSRTRRTITLDLKMSIINRYDAGESIARITRLFGLPRTTVTTIINNRITIKNRSMGIEPPKKKVKKKRIGLVAEMEKDLVVWLREQRKNDILLKFSCIQERARDRYEELKNKSKKKPENIEPFRASRGWFNRFKMRFNMHDLRVTQALNLPGEDIPTPDEFWKCYSIYKSFLKIHKSWLNITSLNTNSVKTKLSTDFTLDFQRLERNMGSVKEKITDMSRQLGPDKIEPDVIDELNAENTDDASDDSDRYVEKKREPDNVEALPQENLTSEVLEEYFVLVEKAMSILEKNDPNSDRSSSVTWSMLKSYSCYRDIYEKHKESQKSEKSDEQK